MIALVVWAAPILLALATVIWGWQPCDGCEVVINCCPAISNRHLTLHGSGDCACLDGTVITLTPSSGGAGWQNLLGPRAGTCTIIFSDSCFGFLDLRFLLDCATMRLSIQVNWEHSVTPDCFTVPAGARVLKVCQVSDCSCADPSPGGFLTFAPDAGSTCSLTTYSNLYFCASPDNPTSATFDCVGPFSISIAP